ncbi:fumarylacetoacetate hydrolase family protein [Verticiella sediminum]|uniref:Fumarylacetoacetate hydrolase family protein n=1 Tax=Verticiella sediminum TaxID=1247510 RepID=A0A556AJD0_9BURK|nr:fumarylacetoacetate hydrolase family protein [Verticiella sediminum]TSH92997.1 fumarylacetoacetate hydrolase family protein [Verticiella sediminum]
MRLASYRWQGIEGWGQVLEASIVPLADAWPCMRTALAAGVDAIAAAADGARARIPLEAVEWLPPVPRPDKILCVGLNYASHAGEAGRELPRYPSLFPRFADSFVGHGQAVVRPSCSEAFDYEGELGVVIGRPVRGVSAAEAMSCVAGYCCLAENSVRDFQRHSAQVTAGKNFERSGSIGPWIVTRDEIDSPADLRLVTRLNGQVVQDASVGDMLFDVPAIIAYVSTFTTLHPGDIIATGTPQGVGMSRNPPLWMAPGDVLDVEIAGVGLLRNPVVAFEHEVPA